MHIATVKIHPTDPNILIVGVPSVLNPTMGRFEPARLSSEHKGYLVHAVDLDALLRFLRIENIAIVDNRSTAPAAGKYPSGPLPECVHCGQPAKRDAKLTRCPGCGQPWKSKIAKTIATDIHRTQSCPACGHTQRGQFTYCSQCGATMPTRELDPADMRVSTEPQTLADAIANFVPPRPSQAFAVLRCQACGYTQRDEDECNRCGGTLAEHVMTSDEQSDISRRGIAKVRAAAAGQPWENLP